MALGRISAALPPFFMMIRAELRGLTPPPSHHRRSKRNIKIGGSVNTPLIMFGHHRSRPFWTLWLREREAVTVLMLHRR